MKILNRWEDVRDRPFQEICKNSKRLLVVRKYGAVGDILMSRFLFEDMKSLAGPDVSVEYALPFYYHTVVKDHPFIDKIHDYNYFVSGELEEEFDVVYDISRMCGAYENLRVPFVDKHRSDIWAENVLGFTLRNHHGHLRFRKSEIKAARELLEEVGIKDGWRGVGIGTFTSSPSKDWGRKPKELESLTKGCLRYGCVPVLLHDRELPVLAPKRLQVLPEMPYRLWLAVISELDYLITGDTGNFHAANLLQRPTIAVFGPVDLDQAGKHHLNKVKVYRSAGRNKVRPAFWKQYDPMPKPDWKYCPCWTHGNCYYMKNRNELPLSCLADISPDEILEALVVLIKKNKTRKPGKRFLVRQSQELTDFAQKGNLVVRRDLEYMRDKEVLPYFECCADDKLLLSILTNEGGIYERRVIAGDEERVTIKEDTWWANQLTLAGYSSVKRLDIRDEDNVILLAERG